MEADILLQMEAHATDVDVYEACDDQFTFEHRNFLFFLEG